MSDPSDRRPPTTRGDSGEPSGSGQRFPFEFLPVQRALVRPFGVTARTAGVEIGGGRFTIRFGPWRLVTPLDNVEGAEITGPYRLWRVAGPVRLARQDDGVTFATTTRRGVCVSFTEPVPAALPLAVLRHSAATVTVADPDGLVAALRQASTGVG